MLTTSLKYVFKYIIFGIIIYLLITYIPQQPIKNPNYTIIFGIMLASLIFFDIIINYNKILTKCSSVSNSVSNKMVKYMKPLNILSKPTNPFGKLSECSNSCSYKKTKTEHFDTKNIETFVNDDFFFLNVGYNKDTKKYYIINDSTANGMNSLNQWYYIPQFILPVFQSRQENTTRYCLKTTSLGKGTGNNLISLQKDEICNMTGFTNKVVFYAYDKTQPNTDKICITNNNDFNITRNQECPSTDPNTLIFYVPNSTWLTNNNITIPANTIGSTTTGSTSSSQIQYDFTEIYYATQDIPELGNIKKNDKL
jgi:hypothetical protein